MIDVARTKQIFVGCIGVGRDQDDKEAGPPTYHFDTPRTTDLGKKSLPRLSGRMILQRKFIPKRMPGTVPETFSLGKKFSIPVS